MGVTMSVEENSNLSIKNWLAILVLAISTFIIVTTELAPVGLLTPMAKNLFTIKKYARISHIID